MKTYARIVDGVAVDVVTGNLEEMFHPDLLPQFEEVPAKVKTGWIKNGKAWDEPAKEPEIVQKPTFRILGTSAFKFLFTFEELASIEDVRKSNSIVGTFWNLLDDPRTETVDLNLSNVQNAIRHTLQEIKTNDVEARLSEILLTN